MSSMTSENTPQSAPTPVASGVPTSYPPATNDDVIDLRVYLDVLVRWWKEILLIGIVFGIVAGGAYWLLKSVNTKVYSASAEAAIVRTISEVTLDERFTTTAETPAAAAAIGRRNSLLALAESPALALAVIEELGDALPEDLRQPANIAGIVEPTMANASGRSGDSDLVRITATTPDPELSALIATSWAKNYVRNVNQIYGQVPDELVASMAQEQESTRIGYESAQQAVEDFVGRSRIDELSRAIADKEAAINTLRNGRNTLLRSLVTRAVDARDSVARVIGEQQALNTSAPILAEQEGKRSIITAYIDGIYKGQAQVVSQQNERDSALLSNYYDRWLHITLALQQATALRSQTVELVEDGDATGSGSSALVLALLKLQAFTSVLDPPPDQQMQVNNPSEVNVAPAADNANTATAPGVVQSSQPVQIDVGATPLQLQLSDATEMTNAEIVAELDSLIATISDRQVELEASITTLSDQIISGANVNVIDAEASANNAVAQQLPDLVNSILASSIITGTNAANQDAATWDVGAFANLYNTVDLQAIALAADSSDTMSTTMDEAEAELRALKSELEAERTTQTELVQARDLAQDAYRSANSKKTELSLARAAAGGELRFASPAILPLRPVSGVSTVLVAAAAFFFGLVLGVLYAFIADAMGKRPFLSRGRAPVAATA